MTERESPKTYVRGVPAPGWDGRYFTDVKIAATAIGEEHGGFLLDERAWVRALVAWDRNCDVRVMKLLSQDVAEVQEKLSLNPRLPVDLFAPMLSAVRADPAHFRHKEIAIHVLARRACPPDLLRLVAESPASREELGTVLANPSCPTDVLARYGTATDALHLPVLHNRSTPTSVLVEMMRRASPQQRASAVHNIASREWAAVRPAVLLLATQDLRELAGLLPQEGLEAMSRDPDPALRRAVADSVADALLLRRLARDPDEHVRAAASRHLLDLLVA